MHERKDSDLSPFVTEWDSNIDRIDSDNQFPKYKTGWIHDPPPQASYGAFINLKDQLLFFFDQLTRFAHDEKKRIAYLEPLVRHAVRTNASITTLNYDPFVERAAESIGFKACQGIETWDKEKRLSWGSRDFNLIKLHGSFEWWNEMWHFHFNDTFHTSPPNRSATITNMLVLYGNQAKLQANPLYLDLYIAFRNALSNAKQISVIGFSFGDDHITECIYQWLRADPERSIRIANGPNFKKEDLPKLIRDNSYIPELMVRAEICPYYASEAIARWYG